MAGLLPGEAHRLPLLADLDTPCGHVDLLAVRVQDVHVREGGARFVSGGTGDRLQFLLRRVDLRKLFFRTPFLQRRWQLRPR